jgi:MATE family multidrug resistance protein
LVVAALSAAMLIGYAGLAPAMRAFRFANFRSPICSKDSQDLFRIGLVTGAASLCETGVFLSSTVLTGIFAVSWMPAHIAVFRTLPITYVILTGFTQAVTIHISRAIGTANPAHREAVQTAAIRGAIVLWATFLSAFWLLPDIAGAIFDSGNEVRMLSPWAGIAASSLVPAVTAFAILRAELKLTAPTAISLFGYWCIGFVSMVAFAASYGAAGIWMGLALGATATAAGSWLYLSFGAEFSGLIARARRGIAKEMGLS